jgi:hypothetical protein
MADSPKPGIKRQSVTTKSRAKPPTPSRAKAAPKAAPKVATTTAARTARSPEKTPPKTPSAKRKRPPQRRKGVSYRVEYAEREPWTVPVWWVNSIFGLFLLVPLGIWSQTFFHCFSRETMDHAFWATEEFWFFMLGMLLWAIAFFGLPRPLLLYVFGHEATHALWVLAMGGRVREFKVGSDGGYIITDTSNFWIALAPYFFPLYSLLVIAVYAVASLFYDLQPYQWVLYGLIGVTWGFHITFTLWMIPKGQTDLSYHGTFFSLVVIYLMNLLVLTLFLIAASPQMSWISFGEELLQNSMDFSEWLVSVVRTIRQSS